MKSEENNSDQKDLEKKVDKLLYLDPAKPNQESSEDDDTPKTRILKLDSKPNNEVVTSEDLQKPANKEDSSDIKPAETVQPKVSSKEEDPALQDPVIITKDNLDSEDQDGSVDEIVAKESDEVLEVEDKIKPKKSQNKKTKSKNIFKKKWFYPLLVFLILIVIFAVPFTRYKILGLFIKKDLKIEIIDSLAQTPVSGAKVSINGKNYLTNGNGDLNIKLGVGNYPLNVSKNYYNAYSSNMFVGFGSNQQDKIKLVANGRRISLKVINAVTGSPINSVKISSSKVTSFSSNNGLASLVLPASNKAYSLNFSADGYNNQSASFSYSPNNTLETVKLTPSGKIYYLSQSNGLINVVSSNLDGTSSHILVNGTSSMDINTTFLYPSSNWQYLVLYASRSSSGIGLYLINTSTGAMTEFDSSNINQYTNPVGWIGNYFVYQIIDNLQSNAGSDVIKSYDASTQQSNVLDQNQTQGSGSSAASQNFNFLNIINGQLVYATSWLQSGSLIPAGINNTLRVVDPNGTNKKDVYSISAQTGSIDSLNQYQPNDLYFGVYSNQSNQTSVYSYSNGTATQVSASVNSLYSQYPAYHLSSSGLLSVWSQNQNGKPVVFWANQNGSNKQQANIPIGYSVVGWYNSNYIVLSKSNKLYIASYKGESNNPLEIAPFAGLNL